jgi:hypothetical protein
VPIGRDRSHALISPSHFLSNNENYFEVVNRAKREAQRGMVEEGLRLKSFLGKRKASMALSFQVGDLHKYPQRKDSISL